MKTHMLSSLAIAALATVTLNATDALAKSGGGGSSGMRSFSAARTSVVVKQFKPVTTPTVKKLTTAVVRDKLKPTPTKTDVRCRYCPLPGGGIPLSGDGKKTLLPSSLGSSLGDALKQQPKLPPVATPLPGGTPPVVTLPPKLPPILTPPPAGTPPVVTLPPKLPQPGTPPIVLPPPVVVNPPAPPVVITAPAPASVGFGVAAAPEAVDVGCTYERSVRKLPGGGLQRVIVKVCPDVIVQ